MVGLVVGLLCGCQPVVFSSFLFRSLVSVKHDLFIYLVCLASGSESCHGRLCGCTFLFLSVCHLLLTLSKPKSWVLV